MLFNSVEYWFFLLGVAVVFFVVPHRVRWVVMLVAGYYFYMKWNVSYAALIAGSTVVDYFVGRFLEQAQTKQRKKAILVVSLAMNLGLLFFFKYWTFFHECMKVLAGWFGSRWETPHLDVLLPVGISFYTFQALSYTIDVYRGRMPAERHFGRWATFVILFPQLVAGPIERAINIVPQIRREHRFDWDRTRSGLALCLWGLFKKVVIADRLGLYVDMIYGNAAVHSPLSRCVATYAFAWQIYNDFSGYTDIAIGSAKILGFDLMENFRQPYLSENIREFWRRWHISLSTWLRDYLYVSLGGNRGTEARTYVNLMLTMLLGGLWHGASANFVIWGGLQGVMLAVNRATEQRRELWRQRLRIPLGVARLWRLFITFHLVCLSWVFFRARDLDTALLMLRGWLSTDWGNLYHEGRITLVYGLMGVVVVCLVELGQVRGKKWIEWLQQKPLALRWAVYSAGLATILLIGVDQGAQFIYFQF